MNIIGGILAYLLIGWFFTIVFNALICYSASTPDFILKVDPIGLGIFLLFWPILVPGCIFFGLCYATGKSSQFLAGKLRDQLIKTFPLKDKRNP